MIPRLAPFLVLAGSAIPTVVAWQSTALGKGESHGSLFASQVSPPKSPVPVTILSGFLGTGKTTVLKHLLQNSENVKIGVIVNDVASVNIDAKLVASSVDGMIQMQNGCACCSLADELFMAVDEIIKGRDLDVVVVELSGVADPVAIRNNWFLAPDFIKDKAEISKVVTVVDAASFGTDYMSWDEARERKGWVTPGEEMTSTGMRKVSELLAEQVEAADLILLNKIDIADTEQRTVAEKVAKALNSKARISPVKFGVIAPSLLLEKTAVDENDTPFDDEEMNHSHSHDHACHDQHCSDASHSHSHEHATNNAELTDAKTHSHFHATSVDQLGLSNFVFKSDKPFHPVRIMDVLNRWPVPIKDTLDLEVLREAVMDGYHVSGVKEESPFVGVIRSKGFCWFAPNKWIGRSTDPWRHDTAMYWSHAGKAFDLSTAGKWWATIPEESMKKYFISNEKEYQRIVREDFVSDEFGDRRQEIVFIGVNLDEAKIRETLNHCLYTDEEMEVYRRELRSFQSVKSANKVSLFGPGVEFIENY